MKKLWIQAGVFTLFFLADAANAAVAHPLLQSITVPDSKTVLQYLLLFTFMSIIPTILLLTTSFTRIVIVLGFLKHAVGQPQVPPNTVIIAMAMFLTFFTMHPAFSEISTNALKPYMQGQLTESQAVTAGIAPLRRSMLKRTRRKDLALFLDFAKLTPSTPEEVPTYVLIPAYMSSELRIAFQIGFMIFFPFLVIDIVVASILMSMGMMMVPPTIISMPFKLLLFVLIDGWNIILRGLVTGFG